jgi:hypothetical protein
MLSLLGHHGEAVPFFRLVVVELVEGVVEGVCGLFLSTNYAEDGAGFGVALDFELFDFNGLRSLGDDVEAIGGAIGSGVGARGFCVVEAEEGDGLFCTTGCVVQARCEAETAVVLGECLMLVPITDMSVNAWSAL